MDIRKGSGAALLFICCVLVAFSLVACGSDDSDGPIGDNPYVGSYQGTWGVEGQALGTWEVTVTASGTVTGTGDGGDFEIQGTVNSFGTLVFGATLRGTATTSNFTGTIDDAGIVSGTWSDGSGQGGIFSGSLVGGSSMTTDDTGGVPTGRAAGP